MLMFFVLSSCISDTLFCLFCKLPVMIMTRIFNTFKSNVHVSIKKIPHTGDKASFDQYQKILVVRQNSPKNKLFCAAILHSLQAKVFKSETTSSHIFPKDSENVKSLDIGLLEMGAKKLLNRVNKFYKNP